LPETWSLLTDAFFTIEHIALGLQQYPDLDRMFEEYLDDFLDCPASAPMRQKRQVEEGRISVAS
jgi:hypothetical protein